ncbi:MAG: SDR family oxidoreductase [Chitinophagaceae bacterium]|jgi:short-subunit dehydrogenase|nr:SDR family oxidoreductase [Flavisolibacter sp.]
MNAVITGASRGIGKSVAKTYALHGYNLFLSSRNEDGLLQTVEELKKDYPNIHIHAQAFDLGKKQQAQLFGEWVVNIADTIDVLVNNAGTFVPGNISDEPDGALEHMLEVNLYSAYHVTRSMLPKMISQKNGHIFTICSIAALDAYSNGGAYSISKFGLLGFTKNLRKELIPHNIKVTAIIPGAVFTDSWKGMVEPERIMKPEDIATLIYTVSRLSMQATVEQIVVRPQLGDL